MREEGLSESQKVEKRQQHAVKETEFLRLKRARLGVEDFTPIKVIGKGAFGEVSPIGGVGTDFTEMTAHLRFSCQKPFSGVLCPF